MHNRINKSVIRTLPALLAAVCLTGCLKGPTADVIAAKYIEAIGGIEAQQKLKTRVLEGTMTIPGVFSNPCPLTITQKAPDKKHSRTILPKFGEAITGVDGKAMWEQSVLYGTLNHSGDMLEDGLADARFHAYSEMVTDGRLSYDKREKIGEHDCHVLKPAYAKGSPWHGKTVYLYIDKEEHLLRRIQTLAESGRKVRDQIVTVDLLDYKRIDGIQYPHGTALKLASGASINVAYHKVTHGADVDDSLFASPSHEDALNWFEGSWTAEVTRVPDGEDAKAEKSQYGVTQTRSSKGTFIVEEDTTGRTYSILSYDPAKKLFRRVVINPRITIQQTGKWDAAKQLMTWTGTGRPGLSVVTHTRFIDTDHAEWETVMKAGDRQVTRVTEIRTRSLEPIPKPEPANLPKPAMAFIQLFEGSWDSELTYIPGGNKDQSSTHPGVVTRKWSSGGRFMIDHTADDEGKWALTYSPERLNYRSVHITRTSTTTFTHHWDEAKQIMTTKGIDNAGNQASGSHHLIDENHHEWNVRVTNGEDLLVEMHCTLKRRKQEGDRP